MTGPEMVSSTGEMTSQLSELLHGLEITSELTGTEMELSIGKMVGGNSITPGLLDHGIQPGEEKDGDQKPYQ